MLVRKLEKEEYKDFKKQLIEKAQQNPMDASYNVTVKVDGMEYVLKVQPGGKHRMVALQALLVERGEHRQNFTLITKNRVLSALLELLLWQGVA